MQEAEKIVEAIIVIALSKYDGPIITNRKKGFKQDSPCAKSKKCLQSLISSSNNNNSSSNNNLEEDSLETDDMVNNFDLLS